MAALVNLQGFVRGTELLDQLNGHNLLHTVRCLRAMSILRFFLRLNNRWDQVRLCIGLESVAGMCWIPVGLECSLMGRLARTGQRLTAEGRLHDRPPTDKRTCQSRRVHSIILAYLLVYIHKFTIAVTAHSVATNPKILAQNRDVTALTSMWPCIVINFL